MSISDIIQGCFKNDFTKVDQLLKSISDTSELINEIIETNTLEFVSDGTLTTPNDSGTNVDEGNGAKYQFPEFTSPLHVACYCSELNTVLLVIEAGAQTNCADSAGRLPIHWACLSKIDALDKVRTIAEVDPQSIGAKDNNHKSPLMLAACSGRNDIVVWLLRQGAVSVDDTDKIGWTALHQAAYNGHVSLVNTLLNCDADPNKPDMNGNTALHIAAEEGKLPVVKALTSFLSCDLSRRNENGATALERAEARPYEGRRNQENGEDDYTAIATFLTEFDATPTQIVMAHVRALESQLQQLSGDSNQLTRQLAQRCELLEQQVGEMEECIEELRGDGYTGASSFTGTTGIAQYPISASTTLRTLDVESPLNNGSSLFCRDEQEETIDNKNRQIAEAFLQNALEIIEKIKCDDHLYLLYDHKVISFTQVQQVKREHTDRKRMEKLLHMLLSKPKNDWAPLLLESCHRSPAASTILKRLSGFPW